LPAIYDRLLFLDCEGIVMDFEKRLESAIQRGQRQRSAQGAADAARALSEEELRNLHSSARINLSEHIEAGLKKLADHFLGFRFETILDDTGWGARISRDDVAFGHSRSEPAAKRSATSFVTESITTRRAENYYSRFQMVVKPYSEKAKIVEIAAKGTIRNKEVLTRSHFHLLTELNERALADSLDNWMIQYAEKFAAQE